MTLPGGNHPQDRQRIFNMALIGIIGQVGCLTPVIILGAIFAGMWLDRVFQTQRIITIVLVFASIPVSLLVILAVVRNGLARLKPQLTGTKQNQEEGNLGKNE